MPIAEFQKLKHQDVVVLVNDGTARYIIGHNPKWVALEDLDSLTWEVVILNEDSQFWKHKGLNYRRIRIDIQDYLFKGEKLRGASTISQQVVKNVFLDQRRSWIRKLKEAFIARRMENELSKKRILEIYLNVFELGENIYGLPAASQYYFEKPCSELTPREAGYLASLLPNPNLYNDAFFTNIMTKRDSVVLLYMAKRLLKRNKIDSAYYHQLLTEQLVFRHD